MSKSLIELITCESADYKILRMNFGEDFDYEGHSIPDHIWIKLLNALSYEVEVKEVSDEDMELGNY